MRRERRYASEAGMAVIAVVSDVAEVACPLPRCFFLTASWELALIRSLPGIGATLTAAEFLAITAPRTLVWAGGLGRDGGTRQRNRLPRALLCIVRRSSSGPPSSRRPPHATRVVRPAVR